MQDVRLAFRALRATPVVSLIAILSLALGIGANTAIFSLVDSVILRALPVKEPGQLVMLSDEPGARLANTRGITSWTNPIWEQVRDQRDLFDSVFAWSTSRFNLAAGGETQFVDGIWASGRMFETLGVPRCLGGRSPRPTTCGVAGRTDRSPSSVTASGSGDSVERPAPSASG
jgi:hypothetical protein